jgi:Na+/H+ antiporter NhaD/arsenite permease-like protein
VNSLANIMKQFAGTNIGTTILLCRVVQAWVEINSKAGTVITQRTFWATVYAMAVGVNYGAFSAAFSAALAGMLWRDILRRKHIEVRSSQFARVNLPIIAITMTIGCAVLIGEVYLVRNQEPYEPT